MMAVEFRTERGGDVNGERLEGGYQGVRKRGETTSFDGIIESTIGGDIAILDRGGQRLDS